MAKGKYEYWLTEDGLLLLAAWARDGLTDEDIATKMNVHPSTLYDYKNKYPEISEALKKGKEIIDIEVENALLKKALAGDIAAQIFWLKNRIPKKWRDKPIDMESGFNEINQNLQTLAEILQNPAPNRELPIDE